ncbi:PEGA domain-containing protein [Alkalimarinus sediminis]|uniref:PEGA domain-containing protein n=1 Tax=Alkalimarinus sediminis TaxID=1632866 RepID=A0A9E8HPS7_9ALTE|nr:PEGA domain-containing protein [Alkalimarinus sediminis]UZW76503.1 PEGA domain-containing protein [Alkalimarinus sediminis]
MVDVRPLIFANALFLMLLVTAGFAHISSQGPLSGAVIPSTDVSEASITNTANNESPTTPAVANTGIKESQTETASAEIKDSDIFADNTPTEANEADQSQNIVEAAPETEQAKQGNNSAVAAAITTNSVAAPQASEPAKAAAELAPVEVPPVAVVASPKPKAAPKPKPKPVATTGTLIIRSNIEGDMVLINGKPYGPTRLEVELPPGSYDIEVAKNGYSSWQSEVSVLRGKKQTLKAKLEHYTTVDYRNGEWINGITTGEGTYLADDGTQYQGAFVNGKFHGIGNITYPDGTEYRGEWFEGVMQGDGTLTTNQGDTFVGIFKDGEFNGEGTLTKANGDIYNGYWVNGSLNGQGSLTTKDGLLFVGGFSENQFHGDGSLTYPDGRHYEGSFSKGQFHGKGIEIYANGKKYAGQFMEGQYHGKGELMNPNGSKITGTFKFGRPFGKATLTTPEGEIFTARTTEPGVCYRLKSYRATQCPPMEGW